MSSQGKTPTPTTPLLSRPTSRHSRSSSYRTRYSQILIPGPFTRPLSRTSRRLLANIPIILSIFLAVFLIVEYTELFFGEPIPTGPPWHGPPFLLPFNVSKLLGAYSPYYPVEEYKKVEGCNVTQVHFLQRHGARFPTKGQEERIKRALSHIKPPPQKMKKSSLAFMRKYRYDLKTDDLLWYGAGEAYAAGILAYNRYSHLAHQSKPFLRASNSTRVVDTAKNWKKGFQLAGRMKLGKFLVLTEREGFNNTLENGSCPAHSDKPAHDAEEAYFPSFATITARLNADAPGSNLTNEDIPALMSMCSFESLYKYKTSPWCGVFKSGPVTMSQDETGKEDTDGLVDGRLVGVGDGSGGEWEFFEYLIDLEKFYNTGPGNPNGRPQGIGYINELIARLTNSPVNDTTQTNRTLDCNIPSGLSNSTFLLYTNNSTANNCNSTFPLNRTMYADFTHDNEMTAILSALGVLREVGTDPIRSQLQDSMHAGSQDQLEGERSDQAMLPEAKDRLGYKEMDPSHPDPHRKWVASKIVPFASRLVVERLSCPNPNPHTSPNGIPTGLERRQAVDSTTVEAVRLLLNDAVLRIPGCTEGLGVGICTMPEFLRSQRYAREMGEREWEGCFEKAQRLEPVILGVDLALL